MSWHNIEQTVTIALFDDRPRPIIIHKQHETAAI